MSGLSVGIQPGPSDQTFNMMGKSADFQSIISTREGQMFFGCRSNGIPIFVSSSADIVDIHVSATHCFDVKAAFASAVPIAMYLQWAFSGVGWNRRETSACLILDDPPLKRRYGFLEFRRALELMDDHNFAMSLAFIPWNWRRTNAEVVSLFRHRPDRLSIAVHGCDHTGGEFAARSAADLSARIKVASLRMGCLQERTSLKHDRVMVFPRGEFSGEAAEALKHNNFIGAVNTEVAPANGSVNKTTVADLWDVAIRRYENFPIFTRRYLTHGLENFAFDILLGKPCFVVAHHQGFEDDARELVVLIDKLNALSCNLVWRSLGDAIRRSSRFRARGNATSLLEMYGSEALVENTSEELQSVKVVKRETDPNCLRSIIANHQPVQWQWENQRLAFTVKVPPRESVQLRCIYNDSLAEGVYPLSVGYKFKTGLRRYLSEARDYLISEKSYLFKIPQRMRQFVR